MTEAQFYEARDGQVICRLCPRECRVQPEQAGFCQIRRHRDGKLLTDNYGQAASIGLDPIEKKPLYHFYPGRPILSVGTIGCNLDCRFCQNWRISRESAPTTALSADATVDLAVRAGREQGSVGLAYTYSEPGVWFEFLMDVMPGIRRAGLKNVLVTNAFLQPEPWQRLLRWTDAANIDLKGFDADFYRRVCAGELAPVLDNIRVAVGRVHVELTTLIIPGENDSPERLREMAQWIAALDPEIPLHLSRYYPNYRFTAPPTPEATMEEARRIAGEYLRYVYLGNLGGLNDTCCPECGRLLIERDGYRTRVLMPAATCPECGRPIPVIQ
jgi:pyruvate formate lyase activating enzyme